jgi:uncharacterized protein YdeI (YjbR/CyaY-like superfamily)
MSKDPRVDEFIDEANAFARPILVELRKRVHAAVPDVEETIRWGMPFYRYKGQLFAGMGAFKAHCTFGFFHPLMRDGDTSLEGMGQFGQIRSVADLPSAGAFARLAKRAKTLADNGVKGPPRPKPDPNRKVAVPRDLASALAKNARARANFEAFAPGCRAEYVKWIEEAKRDETRKSRIATTVAQSAAGKKLYWKYENR